MSLQLDATLRSEAQSVFDGVSALGHPMKWDDPNEVERLFSRVLSLYSFEIEQPVGTIVYRSRALGANVLPATPEGSAVTGALSPADIARILQVTHGDLRVRVAVDLHPLLKWEAGIWWAYALVLPITMALLAGGAWLLYSKALKPVDDLAAAAEHITAEIGRAHV